MKSKLERKTKSELMQIIEIQINTERSKDKTIARHLERIRLIDNNYGQVVKSLRKEEELNQKLRTWNEGKAQKIAKLCTEVSNAVSQVGMISDELSRAAARRDVLEIETRRQADEISTLRSLLIELYRQGWTC